VIALARRGPVPATAVALAVAAIALVYTDVLAALLALWWGGSYYSYGVLVPVFSAWLVWEARHRVLAAAPVWWWPGLAVVAAGFALRAAGGAAGSLAVETLSLPVALAGLALVGVGPERFGAVAFPIGFLALMAPLPEGVIPRLSPPLQWLAADVAAAGLAALGIPFQRDGLFLHLEPVTLHIGEACNGVRFLLAMIVLAVAFAGAVLTRPWSRLALLASAIALALASNQVRVTGTAVLAHVWGVEAATGWFHIAWGKVVYLAALVPFGGLALHLRSRAERSPGAAPGEGD
jgi:exosortase